MWTDEMRARHAPARRGYPSDLSDAEWALIAPLIPPARPGGRPRTTDMRRVVEAILYVLRTGCQWQALPKDFPARSTVYNFFWEWTRYGVWERIHSKLRQDSRVSGGREREPSAGVIDSRSVQAAEKGGSRAIRPAGTRARRCVASSSIFASTPRG
jgi:transposase